MLKLALRQPKRPPMHRDKILPWASCAPFVENSRGVLIHRPRSAQTITLHREPHIAVHYWCGNGVAGKRNLTVKIYPGADHRLSAHGVSHRREFFAEFARTLRRP